MKSSFSLPRPRLQQNAQTLGAWLKTHQLDAYYVSSFDTFINEYVPLEDCHRYYVSGFTGSVAEALVLPTGKVHLFVDGRYHQQADIECDPSFVIPEKCPYGMGLREALVQLIQDKGIKKLALTGARVPLHFKQILEQVAKITLVKESDLPSDMGFTKPPCLGTMAPINDQWCGASAQEKTQSILKEGEGIFLSALDSIAWLTNCRGYQLPYQSTFRAKALATLKGITLFVESDCLVDEAALKPFIKLVRTSFDQLESALKVHSLNQVYFDPDKVTAADHAYLVAAFGARTVVEKPKGILPYHAIKNPVELVEIQDSFAQADQAIWKTILWTKDQVRQGVALSEKDYYNQANKFYEEGGRLSQSFHTIAAAGSNSSIIHFSSPSDQVSVVPGQMMLLDSGAYYRSGMATDCTRTFLSGGSADPEQKKIYTLVLKGLLQVMNCVFPPGTPGSWVDGVARAPILRAGYNYAHGTGHGVGINVHEGEYSVTPASRTPMQENLVGSLEPGIYIPGMGGVRLENCAILEKHPDFPHLLRFKPLSYVGFDFDLIEMGILNDEERRWLMDYETECARRGTSLRRP